MSGPTSVASTSPTTGRHVTVDWARPDLEAQFRAMASDIHLRVVGPSADAQVSLARAVDVFHGVERACTRFDPTSPLMLANAEPDRWHVVPQELFDALVAAHRAHERTKGLFDPRVLETLTSLGYDHSLPFRSGDVRTDRRLAPVPTTSAPWSPQFRVSDNQVRLGPRPIDLGGIGKGLAVRWAGAELAGQGRAVLVEAGGDCLALGPGPDGDGWLVGVEDPQDRPQPIAVLSLRDKGCATSSIRLRRWRSGGEVVHHLIDPRIGRPGQGLLAVTVVDDDPAWAEVWSKTLFLTGPEQITTFADSHGLAALWVDDSGRRFVSEAMHPYLRWLPDAK